MNKSTILGVSALLVAGTASAALVSGFDQRYQADAYGATTAGVWDEAVSGQDATATGTFGTTTTPNGEAAVVNTGAGTSMSFTRDNAVAGQGYTIQAVIRIDDGNTDSRNGPFALGDGGWAGLFMGARTTANGESKVRGGNQGSGGGDALRIEGQSMTGVTDGMWGVYTLAFDATETDTITASFVLADGTVAFSAVEQNGLTTDVGGILNNGLLFAGEVGQAPALNWKGAIADLVVYNSALNSSELAANDAYFYETYAIPEPATLGLIAAFGGGLLFIRRRFSM